MRHFDWNQPLHNIYPAKRGDCVWSLCCDN
nr:MAG TPA: contryphan [Caudoviricetes sp.]